MTGVDDDINGFSAFLVSPAVDDDANGFNAFLVFPAVDDDADGFNTLPVPLQQDKGQLSKFYELIRERNVDLSNTLAVETSLTVFAPSNEAFKMVNKERFKLVCLP